MKKTFLIFIIIIIAVIINANEKKESENNNLPEIKVIGKSFFVNEKELYTYNDFINILKPVKESYLMYKKSMYLEISGFIFLGLNISQYVGALVMSLSSIFIGPSLLLACCALIPFCNGLLGLIPMIISFSLSKRIRNKSILLYNDKIKENNVSFIDGNKTINFYLSFNL